MTSLDEYMKNGYECMSQNNVAQAIEYFQAARELEPNNEEANMCLYMACNRLGKPQYAKKYHDGKIPTNALPLDTSYIKWHKEQVIEKWKRVFSAEFAFDPECCGGDLIDDADVISYQLILSRLKQNTYSKDKSHYYYLACPLYSKDKGDKLPLLHGNIEVEKEGADEISVCSLEYKNGERIPVDKFASIVDHHFRGNNLLEKIEYEYYSLWAHHYLGLWQWEQWHPFANIKDTVGKKHLIMGIDEEMREIASQLNEESEVRGKKLFSFYEESLLEEITPRFLSRLYIKSFLVDEDVLGLCRINPLKKKPGNYGNYFASNMTLEYSIGTIGREEASAVFGSYEGQVLTLGGSFHVVMSHSDAKDGACIIM